MGGAGERAITIAERARASPPPRTWERALPKPKRGPQPPQAPTGAPRPPAPPPAAPPPASAQFEARAKWNACAELKGMSKEEAMQVGARQAGRGQAAPASRSSTV